MSKISKIFRLLPLALVVAYHSAKASENISVKWEKNLDSGQAPVVTGTYIDNLSNIWIHHETPTDKKSTVTVLDGSGNFKWSKTYRSKYKYEWFCSFDMNQDGLITLKTHFLTKSDKRGVDIRFLSSSGKLKKRERVSNEFGKDPDCSPPDRDLERRYWWSTIQKDFSALVITDHRSEYIYFDDDENDKEEYIFDDNILYHKFDGRYPNFKDIKTFARATLLDGGRKGAWLVDMIPENNSPQKYMQIRRVVRANDTTIRTVAKKYLKLPEQTAENYLVADLPDDQLAITTFKKNAERSLEEQLFGEEPLKLATIEIYDSSAKLIASGEYGSQNYLTEILSTPSGYVVIGHNGHSEIEVVKLVKENTKIIGDGLSIE